MQAPEKLALIGGSILLSSVLIFTLKSQASSIIPSVGHSISHVFDHIGDTQKSSNFNSSYQFAQHDGEKTGTWGTAKYYIDKDNNLHIGQGQLSDTIFTVLGQDRANTIKSVNIDQSVQAPQMSSGLFAQLPIATSINGLANVDTSRINKAGGLFANDNNIKELDLFNFDTSNINDMSWMFNNDFSLSKVNVTNFNTSNVNTMYNMFIHTSSLHDLNISNFDTSKVSNHLMDGMLAWNGIRSIKLGKKTYLQGDAGLNGGARWHNQDSNQTTDSAGVQDGNSHPGVWIAR